MLRLAGAALLMAVSTPAYASDWYFVAAAEDYANISFVDKDSIVTTDTGTTRASMFSLLAEPEDDASAYRFEIEVNCTTRRSHLVAAEIYDTGHQPGGEMPMDSGWSPVEPNTQGDSVATFICNGGKQGADNAPAGRALPFDTGKAMLIARRNAK